jgi:hypothetical protein
MSEQLRRAVPRQPTDWFGFYKFDNVKDERWRACRVVDISPLGAGLELFETTPGENMDGRLIFSIEMQGDTRDVVIDKETNSARVGVEFPIPSASAKEYLRTISGVRSRW